MKKILFLTDAWSAHPTANVICVKNITRVLQQRGWDVYVNAFADKRGQKSETQDGIHIEYTNPALSRQLIARSNFVTDKRKAKIIRTCGILLNRITRLFFLPVYPIAAPLFTFLWSRRVLRQTLSNAIDTIISVNAPLDSVAAAYLVKKKYSNVKWIAYYIDGGSNYGKEQNFLSAKKKLQKKSIKWENTVLSYANKIVVMEGHSYYYKSILSDENLKCLEVLNVPLFCAQVADQKSLIQIDRKSKKKEIWTYMGTIRSGFYHPGKLFTWFLRYCNSHNAELHLYGATNLDGYLMRNCDKQHIFYHGAVSHDRADEILRNSDVLVYFRSERLDSVSGKFFEYLMYHKPIVYFGPKNDINWMQLVKYPLGVAIDQETEESTKQLDMIINKKVDLSNDLLRRIYYTSTPEAFVNMIEDAEKEL